VAVPIIQLIFHLIGFGLDIGMIVVAAKGISREQVKKQVPFNIWTENSQNFPI
jgi:hypothetical protein